MEILAVHLFNGRSVRARNRQAGPRVTKTYKREGGYFVTLMKDIKLKADDFCIVQGDGSPYKFPTLNSTNSIIEDRPTINNILFLLVASNAGAYKLPIE